LGTSRDFRAEALAVGVDLVEIRRITALVARYGERFAGRVFTPAERLDCADRPESLAARWAVKEAVAKALGTGFGPVSHREIEVLRKTSGQPELHLHGKARALAEAHGLSSWAVSVSHDGGFAIAFVVVT
jgi:holo-[acyl-carrier protein] synthase